MLFSQATSLPMVMLTLRLRFLVIKMLYEDQLIRVQLDY